MLFDIKERFATGLLSFRPLGLHKFNPILVIELKAGVATDPVIGQIIGYFRVVRQSKVKGREDRNN